MSTVAAVYGRREVEFGIFPSSQRRGGRAINKWIRSEIGAAGVVSSAKLFRPKHFAELTTPSAASSVASLLLLMPQPSPPLRGGEYPELNFSPIRSHLHRAPLQFSKFKIDGEPDLSGGRQSGCRAESGQCCESRAIECIDRDNIRMVKQIESFRSEIEPPPLTIRKVLHHAQIHVDKTWCSQRISTQSNRT